jgi:hypothetical protein
VRTETYFAGAALVRDLERAGTIKHVHHDGGDIIHVEMTSGEHAWIHLIESSIPLAEIIGTLDANRDNALYTLFLFWADRMLPAHDQIYEPDDWMRPLLSLYGDMLYGYEVHARDILIFPVHFEGKGRLRRVRYGAPVQAAALSCERRLFNTFELNGEYLWAKFGISNTKQSSTTHTPAPHPLERLYALLGVAVGADKRAIKRAYRHRARELHPDLNSDPSATARMQALNDAYQRLLRETSDGEA